MYNIELYTKNVYKKKQSNMTAFIKCEQKDYFIFKTGRNL